MAFLVQIDTAKQKFDSHAYEYSRDMQRCIGVQMHKSGRLCATWPSVRLDCVTRRNQPCPFPPGHNPSRVTQTRTASRGRGEAGQRPSAVGRLERPLAGGFGESAEGRRQPFWQHSTSLVEMTCSAPPLPKRAIGCPKEGSEVRVHASRQMGLMVTQANYRTGAGGAGAEGYRYSLGPRR